MLEQQRRAEAEEIEREREEEQRRVRDDEAQRRHSELTRMRAVEERALFEERRRRAEQVLITSLSRRRFGQGIVYPSKTKLREIAGASRRTPKRG